MVADLLATQLESHYANHMYFLKAWRWIAAASKIPGVNIVGRMLVRIVFQADVPFQIKIPRGVVFMHNGLGVVLHSRVKFAGPALVFHNVTLGNSYGRNEGSPSIGHNVFIGAGASILGNVHIGDGAIIGAGAVVATDVPPHHVATGNPATIRPVGDRESVIARHFQLIRE